ncbi:hypothetical protein BDY24DRAFT_415973 [Mrakia frigida]|uniref:uncharacterized protein n=1 Tax=Mrakia frigida TaxID=29902 RepID=UPI003FCC08D6
MLISEPQQCAPLNVSWTRTGSLVATKYNLVLLPFNTEATVTRQVDSNITFETTETLYILPQLPISKGIEVFPSSKSTFSTESLSIIGSNKYRQEMLERDETFLHRDKGLPAEMVVDSKHLENEEVRNELV